MQGVTSIIGHGDDDEDDGDGDDVEGSYDDCRYMCLA